MRELIRRILREQKEQYNTIEMIRNYSGDNSNLIKYKRRLERDGWLDDKDIKSAIREFKLEYWSDTVVPSVKREDGYRKLIQKLGAETYYRIINKKKELFTQLVGDDRIVVGLPSEEWILKNQEDLDFFRSRVEYVGDSGRKYRFGNHNEIKTITQEISHLAELLNLTKEIVTGEKRSSLKSPIQGFIEKNEWSVLNKVATNWSNWSKMIGKREKEGFLGNGSVESKIINYFKEQPISSIIDEIPSQHILNQLYYISYAELDLAEAIQEINDDLRTYEIEKIKNRLKRTTSIGDATESKFTQWLIANKIEFKNFSSPGNLVDMTFSVDLMALINNEWVPIQVKSSDTYSKLLKYNIGGIVVYPKPNNNPACGDWIYVSNSGGFDKRGSFDKDYLNLNCDFVEVN